MTIKTPKKLILGVDVNISVEIQAASNKGGFDEAMQRTAKENCRVLQFGNAKDLAQNNLPADLPGF